MSGKKRFFQSGKGPARGILAFCIGLGLTFFTAHAEAKSEDPFLMDTSHWMSFDHYKDAAQRGTIEEPKERPADTDAPSVPQNSSAELTADSSSAAPLIAAPRRPVDLPVMPGVNKGFAVKVTSTEDDRAPQISVPVIDDKIAPDIHLPAKNWQAPITSRKNSSDDNEPLDVRLSYLPGTNLNPTPSPDHESAMPLTHALAQQRAQIKKKVVEDQKTVAAKANCDTVDSLKKQQLEAIQSDRQTLKALQDAISTLGLQKQLDFMTNSAGSLNASAPQAGSANTAQRTTVR